MIIVALIYVRTSPNHLVRRFRYEKFWSLSSVNLIPTMCSLCRVKKGCIEKGRFQCSETQTTGDTELKPIYSIFSWDIIKICLFTNKVMLHLMLQGFENNFRASSVLLIANFAFNRIFGPLRIDINYAPTVAWPTTLRFIAFFTKNCYLQSKFRWFCVLFCPLKICSH